jgi:hypothetical protein
MTYHADGVPNGKMLYNALIMRLLSPLFEKVVGPLRRFLQSFSTSSEIVQ